MSYKNDSELVILNRYGKASGDAKAELYEVYDRIRDLAVSGPALGGSGMGKFSSLLLNVARMFGSPAFSPSLGSEAINIPGTSYFTPISGGTGITNGGQAAFGLAPFSQASGFIGGGAAPLDAASLWSSFGIGNSSDWAPWGSLEDPAGFGIGGVIAGAASPLAGARGAAAGAGFGRNWVMPAAGIASGIGGLLTTLGPYFGPFGLAGAATGAVLNGVSGAVLRSYQTVASRILTNADTILSNKVKNLESVVKMLDAQQDVLKKVLKESLDGDKKLLDNI